MSTVTRANRSNGHLRGPVTHTPVAERLAMELSLQGIEPRYPACEADDLPPSHRRSFFTIENPIFFSRVTIAYENGSSKVK